MLGSRRAFKPVNVTTTDRHVELLRATASGDIAAFRELFRAHHPAVFRIAYGVLLDHDEAADVAQEVMLKLQREAAAFRPRALLSTWLFRVTINEALSFRRRLARLPRALLLSTAATSSVEEAVGDRQAAHAIRRAMQGLSATHRAVLTLHFDQELSPRELAPILKLTPNAARVRLHRALAELRRAAAEQGFANDFSWEQA